MIKQTKEPHERGELQRRVAAILEAGILHELPKAAVIVFLQSRQWADFKTCRFIASLRTLAKHCGYDSFTSAKRGLDALLEAGILVEVQGGRADCRSFEIKRPSRRPAGHQEDRQDRGDTRPWD